MQIIKRASVIAAKMPAVEIIQDKIKNSPELCFSEMELGNTQMRNFGFIRDIESDAYVTKFTSGYLLWVCVEEKVITARQVKAELAHVISGVENHRSNPVTRMEKSEFKSMLLDQLARAAKTDSVRIAVLITSDFIIIGTTNKTNKKIVFSLLSHIVESISTTTVHISSAHRGITTMLHHQINTGENLMHPFSANKNAMMCFSGMKISYNVNDLSLHEDISKNISKGFEIEKIGLVYGNDDAEFILDKNFNFSSIAIAGISTEDDYINQLDYEAIILNNMLNDFIALFKRDDEKENEQLPESECIPA